MKPAVHTGNIEAAGFVLALHFHALEGYPFIRLPCPRPGRKPSAIAAVIDIHSPATGERARPVRCDQPACTGQGEYDGAFDIPSRRGYVILRGPNAGVILGNFLTQVFSQLVLADHGLVLHSACVVKDHQAYLFHGPSGAGKSTVCRFAPGCAIASEDLTAVRKTGRGFRAWGLPRWGRFPVAGKQGPHKIKGLFRLVKDRSNGLIPASGARAVAGALALPQNQLAPDRIAKALALLDELTAHVPAYELHFKKDASFWRWIR